MELLESKICAMISLGLGSMIFGLIPACFSSHTRNKWPLLLSSLLCFGAGVLLSTSLVHMLPEIRESLPEYQEYTELLFCSGFFILYLIDEIFHLFYDSAPNNMSGNNVLPVVRKQSPYPRYGVFESQALVPECEQRQVPYNPNFNRSWNENDVDYDNPPSQLCHVGHQEPCTVSPVGSIGLLIALSVHALLEGLAVGLETSASQVKSVLIFATNFNINLQVLLMLGAVASHKLVVGFCLGVEIASTPTNTACRHFTSIVVFSLGSVLGIGMGMVVVKSPEQISNFAVPVLQVASPLSFI